MSNIDIDGSDDDEGACYNSSSSYSTAYPSANLDGEDDDGDDLELARTESNILTYNSRLSSVPAASPPSLSITTSSHALQPTSTLARSLSAVYDNQSSSSQPISHSSCVSTPTIRKRRSSSSTSQVTDDSFDFFDILTEDQKTQITTSYYNTHLINDGLRIYRKVMKIDPKYMGYTRGSLLEFQKDYDDVEIGRPGRASRKINSCELLRIVTIGRTSFTENFRMLPIRCLQNQNPEILAIIAFLKFDNKTGFYIINTSTTTTPEIVRKHQKSIEVEEGEGPVLLQNLDTIKFDGIVVKFIYTRRQ